uniref:Uncharacterized protein n=1 Tax=Oryza glumipatula TaxID=40148 RepID=A0A0E0AEL4_9ORYZ
MANGGARSCAAAANRATWRRSWRGGQRPERLFGVVQGSSRRVVAQGVAEREANGGAQPSAAAAGTEHDGAVIAPRGARPGKQRGGARSSGRATASWFDEREGPTTERRALGGDGGRAMARRVKTRPKQHGVRQREGDGELTNRRGMASAAI